jgi:hypothetical protein
VGERTSLSLLGHHIGGEALALLALPGLRELGASSVDPGERRPHLGAADITHLAAAVSTSWRRCCRCRRSAA